MTSSKDARRVLHIDIETYSEVDLGKAGVFAYCEHPSFEVLLFAYAFDDDAVQVVDLACGEDIPAEVGTAMLDGTVLKMAHNAAFEMSALDKYGFGINAEDWMCSMAMATMQGLPASLGALSDVMGLEMPKMSEGKALIRYFCKPCKPSKVNGGRTRNLPHHEPEKWEIFKRYCARDVEAEREITNKLLPIVQPDFEREVWLVDRAINMRGVMIDVEMVNNAIAIDERLSVENASKLNAMTGLDNPNSNKRFKDWLAEQGVDAPSLTKQTAADLIADDAIPRYVRDALALRAKLGKTSTAKYLAMQRAVNDDDRVRGLFQYYGGARTGRWAGRLVQLQNLPQNHIEELDFCRREVAAGDSEGLGLIYDSVPDVLSQLIRTALIAKPGCKFVVADYSAIEARVIAWLAGEQWRREAFKHGEDIYCKSASAMFGVPVVKHGVNGELRQKGKVAELACGYGGSVGALSKMGGERMGLTQSEMKTIVDKWRAASPSIVRMWHEVEEAAITTIETGKTQAVKPCGIRFGMMRDALVMTLRSGRVLCYRDAGIGTNRFGSASIEYSGMNQLTRKWQRLETYGGKLVENIVQATARDVLALAMCRLENKGYEIVGHVHDEVIIEAPMDTTVEEVCDIMCEEVDWSRGLILNAEGYETPYYKKD